MKITRSRINNSNFTLGIFFVDKNCPTFVFKITSALHVRACALSKIGPTCEKKLNNNRIYALGDS